MSAVQKKLMNKHPKISIITPSYNQADYLEETILSIIQQGYPNLEYIIIDGGSTDGSIDIIKKYEAQISYWVSETDEGQYDAVQKGFDKSTGEIMAWINADDKYHHNAFFAVAEIFKTFPQVHWLQGYPTEYNEQGVTINRITLPWARWSKYRYHTYDFQFIEQESCFWTRSLWERAGGYINTDLKLASDMELWMRFFRHEQLYTTLILLAGFRHRTSNQRSKDFRETYLEECLQTIKKEWEGFSLLQKIHLRCLQIIGPFFGLLFFFHLPLVGYFYIKLYRLPRVIGFDIDNNKYCFTHEQAKHPPIIIRGKQISIDGTLKWLGIRK